MHGDNFSEAQLLQCSGNGSAFRGCFALLLAGTKFCYLSKCPAQDIPQPLHQ